jgi:hypothetical protein
MFLPEDKDDFRAYLDSLFAAVTIVESTLRNYRTWANRLDEQIAANISSMGLLSDSDIQELADSMPARWNQYHREDARVMLRHYRRYKENALLAEAQEGLKQAGSEREERERILRSIALRRGQKVFRDSLIQEFGCKCVITLTEDQETLEAAHIKPYANRGATGLANGLLLRSDIHTLFDLHLISIDPGSLNVFCGRRIRTSQTYVQYHGTPSLLSRMPILKTDLGALRDHFEETKG